MCANRSVCVAFAHIFCFALQELQSGDITVQLTIVLEAIDDIGENNLLATYDYVQKNWSTCKWGCFRVMLPLGTYVTVRARGKHTISCLFLKSAPTISLATLATNIQSILVEPDFFCYILSSAENPTANIYRGTST